MKGIGQFRNFLLACSKLFYFVDYLRNAECIKQKAIDEDICKKYYDELLEHIQTGKSTDDMCW